MEQRDYLKKQIDQLGRVLGKLLTQLLGFKNGGQTESNFEIVDQALVKTLGLDLKGLTEIEVGRFIKTLKEEKDLTDEHLDQLGEILLLTADGMKTDSHERKELYEKCLIILEHLEGAQATYSLDRHSKINKLKKIISLP